MNARAVHPPRAERTRARLAAAALALLVSLAAAQPALAQARSASAPLDFRTAIELARKGPSVALAQLTLAQAEAASQATFSAASGTLQGGYSQRWTQASGFAPRQSGLVPFSLDATFDVVPYGPAFDSHQTAGRAVETARLALSDTTRQVTLEAAQAYLQALRGSARVTLDASALDQARAFLAHETALRASGDATDDDVATAQVAATQASTTLTSDRLALESALATLSDLVGEPVGAVSGEPPSSSDPQGEDAAALERRSDVRQAALDQEGSRQAYAAQLREALPSASASASLQGGNGNTSWNAGFGYDTRSFQPSFQAAVTPGGSSFNTTTSTLNGTSFAVSLSVTVPLDTGLGPALQSARLAVTTAQQKLERTRQQAALAIGAARRALQSARTGLQLAASQRGLAQTRAAEASRRFELGLIAGPDLAQATLAADQARLAYAGAEDALLLARMGLAQALGLDPMEVF